MKTITLDGSLLNAIAGQHDRMLRTIENRFHVQISARGDEVRITSSNDDPADEAAVASLLEQLGQLQQQGVTLAAADVKTAIGLVQRDPATRLGDHFIKSKIRVSARRNVVPKSANQRKYITAIAGSDMVFGIGPAGTGKTYLAVAMAVSLLNDGRVKRIILARPAVEAGERLGFLPGDIAAKVDPYLRPLHDALFDMLEPDRAEQLIERGTIEVAPLAFMRGRTLNESFVILDEAQNTTSEQMKMFLTRIGFDSKAVVTGDITQIDLPPEKISGLVEANEIVRGIPGIAFVHFDETDVVRHPLVQRIIRAYDRRKPEADGAVVLRVAGGGDGTAGGGKEGGA